MDVNEQLMHVVTVRVAGFELFAVDQMAELAGKSRSEVVRHAIAQAMRSQMREHPRFPMHPAWANAVNDRWAVSLYQYWASVIAQADPRPYLEQVTLDGVTAYRLNRHATVPMRRQWHEPIERVALAEGGGE